MGERSGYEAFASNFDDIAAVMRVLSFAAITAWLGAHEDSGGVIGGGSALNKGGMRGPCASDMKQDEARGHREHAMWELA